MNKEAIRSILPWIALGATATFGVMYLSGGSWQRYTYGGIGVIISAIRYLRDARVEKEPRIDIAMASMVLSLFWSLVVLAFLFAPLFRNRSR